jgi:hypothetical protein
MSKHVLVAAALTLGTAEPVSAGDQPPWYPKECKAIQQCAPVDSLTWADTDGGGTTQLSVSSVHGKAVVPRGFPVQDSKDQRAHVCLLYDPFGSLEVTCLLFPRRIF